MLIAEGEPKAESFVDACHDCKCAVWRAFSNPKQIDMVLCAICAVRRIKAEKKAGEEIRFEPPTREQLEEARWWLTNFGATKES
jgi:hypothetical protein